MNTRDKDTIAILKSAIDREVEARDFYRSCRELASAEGVKEILGGLVEDEQRHHDILLRLMDSFTHGESPSVNTRPSDTAKTRLERAFTRISLDDPDFNPKTQNITGILGKALEIEKESFNNYSKAEVDSTEEAPRAIYRFLAGEENQHYILIDNLMSYLDVPGKWLYTEENLVFQNG